MKKLIDTVLNNISNERFENYWEGFKPVAIIK